MESNDAWSIGPLVPWVAGPIRQLCLWDSWLASNSPRQKHSESELNAVLVPHSHHGNQAHRRTLGTEQLETFPAPPTPTYLGPLTPSGFPVFLVRFQGWSPSLTSGSYTGGGGVNARLARHPAVLI